MTSGEYLIKSLGLTKFPNPRINHLVDGAYRVYFIYVDSSSPGTAITKNTLKTWLPKMGAYKYPFEKSGETRTASTTPLLDLKDWNGNLAPADFILIDLAGRFGKQSRFIWEGVLPREALNEDVTLKDLYDFGMSDFTQQFRQDKNASGQRENKAAKLISCELQPDGSVIFSWLTEATKYASPVSRGHKILKYPDGKLPGEVIPGNDFEIVEDPSKTYTMQIQIMDVLQWLDTYPDKKIITRQDIKDILNVASIKLWSTIPSFHWQGQNFNLSVLNGSIHPTDIAPTSGSRGWKDRHDVSFLSKDLGGLLSPWAFSFWLNPISSMLSSTLKKAGYLK